MRDKSANISVTARLTGAASRPAGQCVKYFVMFRESGTERRAMPRSVKMKLHREAKGRRGYAYACDRPCAVFSLSRMGHWNGDRDCEPAQLTAVTRMGD